MEASSKSSHSSCAMSMSSSSHCKNRKGTVRHVRNGTRIRI
jgi:hypothetical protein